MINALAKKTANSLLKSNVIAQGDYDIYEYGLEVLLATIIKSSALLILASIFGSFIPMLIFIVTFGIVRNYAGGYHKDDYLKCFTLMMFISFIPIYFVVNFTFLNELLSLVVMSLISLLIVVYRAPVDTPNKPISKNHGAELKRKSIICVLIIQTICILIKLLWPEYSLYVSVAVVAMLVESFTLLPKSGVKKERER